MIRYPEQFAGLFTLAGIVFSVSVIARTLALNVQDARRVAAIEKASTPVTPGTSVTGYWTA